MTGKLRWLLLLAVVVPQAAGVMLLAGSDLAAHKYLNQVQAFVLGLSLLVALFSPDVAAFWLLGKNIQRMQQLCTAVKQGDYQHFITLPNESAEGDQTDPVKALMRDMNWMAKRIGRREQDLQQAVTALKESRHQVQAQNEYLSRMNEELLVVRDNLEKRTTELEQACCTMENMAMTDALTTIANRRCFFDHLNRHFAAKRWCCKPLSLLMIDIDWFKRINDTYGHQAGDEVLIELAAIIRANSRETDLPARVGGEEYALLLPGTDRDGAICVAQRIRTALMQRTFHFGAEQPFSVTASIGICTLHDMPCWERDSLYSYADKALYYSKHNGRNSISVYDPDKQSAATVGLC